MSIAGNGSAPFLRGGMVKNDGDMPVINGDDDVDDVIE